MASVSPVATLNVSPAEHLFHCRDDLATDCLNTSPLFQSLFEFVFMSARRDRIVSTTFNSTSQSASNCIVPCTAFRSVTACFSIAVGNGGFKNHRLTGL